MSKTANKVMINGTIYQTGNGKTLINGTIYRVTGGKVLIEGAVRPLNIGVKNKNEDEGNTSQGEEDDLYKNQ
jgi:hypothetical protein